MSYRVLVCLLFFAISSTLVCFFNPFGRRDSSARDALSSEAAKESIRQRIPNIEVNHDFGVSLRSVGESLAHEFTVKISGSQKKAYETAFVENPRRCCVKHEVKIDEGNESPTLRVKLSYRVPMPGETAWAIRIVPRDASAPAIVCRAQAKFLPWSCWSTEIAPSKMAVGESRRIDAAWVRYLPKGILAPLERPVVRTAGPVTVTLDKGRIEESPDLGEHYRIVYPVIVKFASGSQAGVHGAQIEIKCERVEAITIARLE